MRTSDTCEVNMSFARCVPTGDLMMLDYFIGRHLYSNMCMCREQCRRVISVPVQPCLQCDLWVLFHEYGEFYNALHACTLAYENGKRVLLEFHLLGTYMWRRSLVFLSLHTFASVQSIYCHMHITLPRHLPIHVSRRSGPVLHRG